MLPKFLLADNSQEIPEKLFVVHTKNPRCIIECSAEDFNEDQEIHWLDGEPNNPNLIDDVLEDAEEFFENELENQDNLYEEEFGEDED